MMPSIDFSALEQQHGLPSGLLQAVMQTESGGDPLAVSPAGAQGLFQFMPATAKQYGIDPFDPQQAAEGAACMYGDLARKYNGDLPSMLAAYNWGQGNVDKKGLQSAPAETVNYINKINGLLADSGQSANDVLPEGFVLDKSQESALPAGFVLDNAPQTAENSPSFLGEMVGNAKHAVQNAKDLVSGNFDMGGGTIPSPRTESLADKLFTPDTVTDSPLKSALAVLHNISGNTSPSDWSGALLEKFGNSAPGKAVGVIGGLNPVYNAAGTALNRYANPAIEKATGIAPDNLALLELAAPTIGLKKASTVSDPTANLVKATAAEISKPKPAPATAADLANRANKAYAAAEATGGVLTPVVTNKFLADAKSVLPQTSQAQSVFGDSPTVKLVEKLDNLKGRPLTLRAAQEIDEGLGDAIDSHFQNGRLSKEGKKIADIQDKFRQTIEQASPQDVMGGKAGFDSLKEGRDLWARSMRMRDVERIISRAEQMDNPVTGIKTGFRTLYNNPNKLRGFNAEERGLIKDAAKTGVVTDALRLAGSRLGPIAAGASGFAGGGIAGAGLAALTDYALSGTARTLANARQMKKANRVLGAIARGPKTSKATLPAIANNVARTLPNNAISSALAALAMQGDRRQNVR